MRLCAPVEVLVHLTTPWELERLMRIVTGGTKLVKRARTIVAALRGIFAMSTQTFLAR